MTTPLPEGILLLDKPAGKTSFFLVTLLRRLLHVKKIGHAGTLDPFAKGVMVMLVGQNYTKLSNRFLDQDKEYVAKVRLGIETDTFDPEGKIVATSDKVPTLDEVETILKEFQGSIEQIPPMFSAKKVNGKKLCDLARKGQVVERAPIKVEVAISLLAYHYPYVELQISCSKGTYVRTLAQDIGKKLGCGAHVEELTRTRSGSFTLSECLSTEDLQPEKIHAHLRRTARS